MGKTGVDKAVWDTAVSKAGNAVASIFKPTINELGKTTLSRFKKMIETQNTLANTVESFKKMSEGETKKMKQVAEKIVSEDHHASQSMQQKTTKVRFK